MRSRGIVLGAVLVAAACGGGRATVAQATPSAGASVAPTAIPAPTPTPTPSPSPTPVGYKLEVTAGQDLAASFIGLPAARIDGYVRKSVSVGDPKFPLPFDPRGKSFTIREFRIFGTTALGFDVADGTQVVTPVNGAVACPSAVDFGTSEGTAVAVKFTDALAGTCDIAQAATVYYAEWMVGSGSAPPTAGPLAAGQAAVAASGSVYRSDQARVVPQVVMSGQRTRLARASDLLQVNGKIAFIAD